MFNNGTVAIDIGSKNIKIVAGNRKNNRVSISNFGYCATPKNAFFDGNLYDKTDVINAVSSLLIDLRIKSKNVLFGVKGQDVITRHIEMPIIPDKQLKQAVMLEMQQYLPMDPNEYVIDSKKIGRFDNKEKRTYNILLVAAPKKKVNDYYHIADKLGLKVEAIDLYANSMTRLIEQKDTNRENIKGKRCISLIDIGYESSIVALIEDGKLFFEREIGIGVKDIDQMLKKAYAASDEEIDYIRNKNISLNSNQKNTALDDPRIYFVNNNARQIFDGFIDGIVKVFDFYTSSGFGRIVSNIYLCGGGSLINGLPEYIKNTLNIDTKVYDESLFNSIYKANTSFKGYIGLYANCLSLLLRKD